MLNVVFSTPLTEITAELGSTVRPNDRRPTEEIEPEMEVTGDSFSRKSLELLVDRVSRPLVNTY